ncbi:MULTISPECIES: hypothetical protein [Micrococcaceae]|uniref:hypothetical protein n=1 Tax=Micrococcaceae TaxID=1268 RepID=UPI00047EDBFC|nr:MULTISPECIES: hypothetical protein [Micrococcaceae]BCW56810.1 hypothetical protein StoSoilB20_01570 [Arthrobacter sp. StoSoilB20]
MTTTTARAAEISEDPTTETGSIPTTGETTPTRHGFRRTVVANWRELLPDDTVVLVAPNKECITGVIDAVTKDGAFLWLRQGHGRDRQLFYRSDGYKILVDPRST